MHIEVLSDGAGKRGRGGMKKHALVVGPPHPLLKLENVQLATAICREKET